MTHESHIALIDRYLTGSLTPAEKEQWQELLNDEAFRQTLSDYENIQKAATLEGRDELRALLASWDKPKVTPIRRRLVFWSSVAASILIIVVVFFLVRPVEDPQSLAAAYVEPYPNLIAPLQKSGGEAVTPYEEAFHLYETGYYGKAASAFGTLDPADEGVQFYGALTSLLDERMEDAITQLGSIADAPGHRFRAPAMWYLALAEIMEGDIETGKQLLNDVADSDSPLADDAKGLLDKINN